VNGLSCDWLPLVGKLGVEDRLGDAFRGAFPNAKVLRCWVHRARNVMPLVPRRYQAAFQAMWNAVAYADSLDAARVAFETLKTKGEPHMRLYYADVLKAEQVGELDAQAVARVDAAVAFADAFPFPEPDSLYDDVYVLGREVRGWYSIETSDGRASGAGAGEPAANDEIPQQLARALAASDEGSEEAA